MFIIFKENRSNININKRSSVNKDINNCNDYN